MDLTYADEVRVERIGSPVGHKVVKAKAVKGGVKVKADGTPMELMTVVAVLLDQVMWDYSVPLHELFQVVEEIIRGGDVEAQVGEES
jgi:hypothetical protein